MPIAADQLAFTPKAQPNLESRQSGYQRPGMGFELGWDAVERAKRAFADAACSAHLITPKREPDPRKFDTYQSTYWN